MKVYLIHNLTCFLTVEVNVSAMKLSTYRSTENTVVFSNCSLSAFLDLGAPNCAYFKSYF